MPDTDTIITTTTTTTTITTSTSTITTDGPRRRTRRTDEFAEWLQATEASAFARARAAQWPFVDACDISHDVVEYALRQGRAILALYPDPHIFAAVRTYHAGIAWVRREGVQSGQGAGFGRARQDLHATLSNGKTLAETLPSPFDTAESALEWVHGDAVRLAMASSLDPRTARWVWDVKALGLTVADVARRDGVSRETVSRAVNRGVRDLKPVLSEFVGG